MREILFRGKDEHTAQWVYGHFYTTPYVGKDGKKFDYHFISNPNAYGSNLVIPNSIGEFTGLLDRNGKRIFEGDILLVKTIRESVAKETRNDEYTAYGIVVFNKGHFELDGKGLVLCTYWGLKSLYTAANFKEYEIIGNIHDNPELVEVEQ